MRGNKVLTLEKLLKDVYIQEQKEVLIKKMMKINLVENIGNMEKTDTFFGSK